MENYKEKLIQLVQKLQTDNLEKGEMLKKIEAQGVTSEILEQTGELIKKTIEDYEGEALEEEKNILQEMEQIKADFHKELESILKEQKQAVKEASEKKDAEQIEAIRKQLQ